MTDDSGFLPPRGNYRELLSYRLFVETRPPEVLANIALCLIHQANYLLALPVARAADPVVSNVSFGQRAGTKLFDIGFDVANADGDALSMSVDAMDHSIVTSNSAPSDPDVSGPFDRANNLVGVDARLAPLGDYGGPTETMPPLPGSPAIAPGAGFTPANPVFDITWTSFPGLSYLLECDSGLSFGASAVLGPVPPGDFTQSASVLLENGGRDFVRVRRE